MNALLPRLDREQTRNLLDEARELTVEEIAERMPNKEVRTTSSALGGLEIGHDDLAALRSATVDLAREHNYPGPGRELPRFDALCAREVHSRLRISPHEASEEEAWSHLTCCWLLDIAAWRWGGIGDSDRRFRGDVNRNTFRRLWWRAEVLGPEIDLTSLGEDELVNIMERPTVASNRRLARALAGQFLSRVDQGGDDGRMFLMREAGKWLVRLTPIIDFSSLDDVELNAVLGDVLDVATRGGALSLTPPARVNSIGISDGVEQVPRAPDLKPQPESDPQPARSLVDLEELFEVALGIARRTGRVTNSALREVAMIESQDARRVLQDLVERAELLRRGKAKGTYYVLPGEAEVEPDEAAVSKPPPSAGPVAPPTPSPRAVAGTAVRRFLNRNRINRP
jgi:hypothetical protein